MICPGPRKLDSSGTTGVPAFGHARSGNDLLGRSHLFEVLSDLIQFSGARSQSLCLRKVAGLVWLRETHEKAFPSVNIDFEAAPQTDRFHGAVRLGQSTAPRQAGGLTWGHSQKCALVEATLVLVPDENASSDADRGFEPARTDHLF